jgi:hypothetical protein
MSNHLEVTQASPSYVSKIDRDQKTRFPDLRCPHYSCLRSDVSYQKILGRGRCGHDFAGIQNFDNCNFDHRLLNPGRTFENSLSLQLFK